MAVGTAKRRNLEGQLPVWVTDQLVVQAQIWLYHCAERLGLHCHGIRFAGMGRKTPQGIEKGSRAKRQVH